jgi:hypothetical protein
MRTARVVLLGLFCVGLTHGPALPDTLYLEATFDDKTPDQPIGLGGADVGEPFEVYAEVTAIVRTGPMPTPCLEIADASTEFAGSALFRFLGDAEITDGIVTISAEFWFPAFDEFYFHVTDEGQPNRSLAAINFEADGTVELYDLGTPEVVGTYELDGVFLLTLTFDMDAGTFDLELGGEPVFADRPHGVESAAVERLAFGVSSDPDQDGLFYVDTISVRGTPTPAAKTTWGRIKGLLR